MEHNSSIKLVKHASGLEFMGKCDQGENVLTMTAAFQVITRTGDNQVQMALIPLSIAAENSNKGLTARFELAQVIGIYDPAPELFDIYQKLTGCIIMPQPAAPKMVAN